MKRIIFAFATASIAFGLVAIVLLLRRDIVGAELAMNGFTVAAKVAVAFTAISLIAFVFVRVQNRFPGFSYRKEVEVETGAARTRIEEHAELPPPSGADRLPAVGTDAEASDAEFDFDVIDRA